MTQRAGALAMLAALVVDVDAADLEFTRFSRTAEARVVIVEDPKATEAFLPRPDAVEAMLEQAITNLLRTTTPEQAWLALVSTQDVVGIKVYSVPGLNCGTRPAVAAAVAKSLLKAGLAAQNIIVWDKSESDLRVAGFYELTRQLGIRVTASSRAGYDDTNYYDTPLLGKLVYGDHEFEKQGDSVGRKSFVSKLVSQQMTKIINVTPMLNHNLAGVTGNLFSLTMGSVDNTARFEADIIQLSDAVPDIYAMPVIGDRVVLNITDALICQYEGSGQHGLLHYSAVLNQLRLSKDPVALDVLSIKELDRQRRAAKGPFLRANLDIYHNASLLQLGVSATERISVERVN